MAWSTDDTASTSSVRRNEQTITADTLRNSVAKLLLGAAELGVDEEERGEGEVDDEVSMAASRQWRTRRKRY